MYSTLSTQVDTHHQYLTSQQGLDCTTRKISEHACVIPRFARLSAEAIWRGINWPDTVRAFTKQNEKREIWNISVMSKRTSTVSKSVMLSAEVIWRGINWPNSVIAITKQDEGQDIWNTHIKCRLSTRSWWASATAARHLAPTLAGGRGAAP